MKKNKISRIIFAVIMLALFLPMLQMLVGIINITALDGVFDKTPFPEMTVENWFSGNYQQEQEKYAKENFGFRGDLIRLHNQSLYSLYEEEKNKSVVLGKEGYLFEKPYVEAYYGHDFVGYKNIENKVDKLKAIKEAFDALGKELVVVLAPNKARYYAEFLPERRLKDTVGKVQNYDVYKQFFQEKEIPLIDVDAWFLGMKPTAKYPLIPKGGIHWSTYGEIMFADSLLRYMEQKLNKKLPVIDYSKVEISTKTKYRDDDIERLLNTMWRIENLPMAYPAIKYNSKNKYKPKLLLIGDSFYSGLYFDFGFQKSCLDPSSEYWYYAKKIYPGKAKVAKINIRSHLANKDFVVLLVSTYGLHKFAWGGIDKLHKAYCTSPIVQRDPAEEKSIRKKIKNNPKWLARLQEKAQKNGITLDSMVNREIDWLEKNK